MTIYEKMVQAGVKIENHCSDLYVPKNKITDRIVADYEFPACVSVFRDNIDRELWYDIAFAYEPFWSEKQYGISPLEWDRLTREEQKEHVKKHNITIKATTNIAEFPSYGFGKMDSNGFWEYQLYYDPIIK